MPCSFLAIACKKLFYGFIRVFQEYQIYPFKNLLQGFPPKPLLVLQGFSPKVIDKTLVMFHIQASRKTHCKKYIPLGKPLDLTM